MNPVRTTLCATLIGVFTLGSAFAAPLMLLPETEFDFGYVPQHAMVTHVFWVKSVGDSDLKIVSVVPGCSCTQLPVEKTLIPSGDSASVELVFKTQYYRQRLEKHPQIFTNEGPGGAQLTFRATVIDRPDSTYPIIIAPYKLDISQIGKTPLTGADFTITNRSEEPLRPRLVSSAPRLFSLSLPEEIAPGASAPARLTLNETALDKSFEESFTIELNDARKTRFTTPVKRTVRSAGLESPFD